MNDANLPPHNLKRRDFINYSLSAAALLGLTPIVDASPTQALPSATDPMTVYKKSIVIDTMMIEGTDGVNATAGVEAGFTASVIDIEGYPRTPETFNAAMERWKKRFEEPGSRLLKVTQLSDIQKAKAESKFGIILTSQDGSILGASTFSSNDSNLKTLENYYGDGLRVLQITHSDRNALGDSYMEATNAGLSRLGKAVVEKMNALRILIDLSHCGEQTSLETLKLSTRPCAITHAGCRALLKTGRNKTDEVIRLVASKGGYFGVFNMSVWLTTNDTSSIEDCIDHIEHAINVGGVDHIGFGSDIELEPKQTPQEFLKTFSNYNQRTFGLPGSEAIPKHVVTPELHSIHRMERIAFALSKRGRKDAEIEKILGRNFARIFGEVCG